MSVLMGSEMDAENIGKKIVDNKPYLKKVYHIKEIGVFGSFIRGEQTESSDIDLLVEFEKGHSDLFNFIRLKDYLEELLGRKVDLVTKKAVKSRLRERILSEVKYV
jgi:predicted nucleotidyltransferase